MTFPILGGNSAVAGDYSIDNSLRLSRTDSAHLDRTPASAGNRRTFTISTWFKRGEFSAEPNQMIVGAGTSAPYFLINLLHSPENEQMEIQLNAGVATVGLRTNRLFRDVSAWYHVVLAVDTTNATADNRVRLYINGVEETSFATRNNPSLNFDCPYNNTVKHTVGDFPNGSNEFDGYLAEFHSIDGQALSPTDFGEFDEDSGIWKPIEYSGSYGTNGFYLDFENSGSLGADQSGNGNDFTPTNLASTDQVLDTPTNNFATLNPLANGGSALQEGSLECITSTGGFWGSGATQGITSGKWYMEFRDESGAGQFGITDDVSEAIRLDNGSNDFLGAGAYGYAFQPVLGRLYNNYRSNSSFTSFTTTGFSAGDVIGVAFDMDNKKIYYSVDGTFQNSQDPVNGTNPAQTVSSTPNTYFFAGSDGSGASSRTFQANFGQDSSFAGNETRQNNSDGNGYGDFYYAPPSGYLALCTQNLATELSPTIDDGSEYFNTITYTANRTARSLTGVGFQPDWVWIKDRGGAQSHALFDSNRGVNKQLRSNTTGAELTAYSDLLTSFDSDGFSLGADASVGDVNYDLQSHVAWNWKANAGSTSSNTDGSITSTVQANTTAGFSIVTYTGNSTSGATVGHGLGKVPAMFIIKNRGQSNNWPVYHQANTSAPETEKIQLDSTAATADTSDPYNDTAPTSSVFTLGGWDAVNSSSYTYVAYCFAEIEGYSKFGSYTGNGSTDGTFVYTGFRPAWVMVKRTDSTGNWVIYDSKRNGFNVDNDALLADTSNAEFDVEQIDLLSNGLKFRSTANSSNSSGGTYIYACFSANPFVSSTSIPVTAR